MTDFLTRLIEKSAGDAPVLHPRPPLQFEDWIAVQDTETIAPRPPTDREPPPMHTTATESPPEPPASSPALRQQTVELDDVLPRVPHPLEEDDNREQQISPRSAQRPASREQAAEVERSPASVHAPPSSTPPLPTATPLRSEANTLSIAAPPQPIEVTPQPSEVDLRPSANETAPAIARSSAKQTRSAAAQPSDADIVPRAAAEIVSPEVPAQIKAKLNPTPTPKLDPPANDPASVYVHIGRVEVRVQPQQPPRPVQRAPELPAARRIEPMSLDQYLRGTDDE